MKILFVSLITLFAAHTAQAAVIVEQPLDAGAIGEYSNLGETGVRYQQVADDFTLAQTTILDSVSWYGRYDDGLVAAPNPTVFSIRLFDDNGGTPETSPFKSLDVSVTPVDSGSSYPPGVGQPIIPWYFYKATLPNLSLDAGIYWLSILENDSNTLPSGATQWLWADSTTAGDRSIRSSDTFPGNTWNTALEIDHAFTLTGSEVPLPAGYSAPACWH